MFKCVACGKEKLEKDEIAICKKLLWSKTPAFFCLGCLADYLNTTVDEINDKIEEFKSEGCKLFQ